MKLQDWQDLLGALVVFLLPVFLMIASEMFDWPVL